MTLSAAQWTEKVRILDMNKHYHEKDWNNGSLDVYRPDFTVMCKNFGFVVRCFYSAWLQPLAPGNRAVRHTWK